MSITIKEMTEDDIKDMMAEFEGMAILLGFENIEKYEDYKYYAAQGMIRFGGSFVHCLGHALAHADTKNSAKIITAFREYCDEHGAMYKKWETTDRFEEYNDQ